MYLPLPSTLPGFKLGPDQKCVKDQPQPGGSCKEEATRGGTGCRTCDGSKCVDCWGNYASTADGKCTKVSCRCFHVLNPPLCRPYCTLHAAAPHFVMHVCFITASARFPSTRPGAALPGSSVRATDWVRRHAACPFTTSIPPLSCLPCIAKWLLIACSPTHVGGALDWHPSHAWRYRHKSTPFPTSAPPPLPAA